MKTQVRSVARMFKRHLARFLSLIFIVLISIGFVSGLGTAADQIRISLANYYAAQNVSDIIVKSRSSGGFTDEELRAVRELLPDAAIEEGISLDISVGEGRSVRYQFMELGGISVNIPDLIVGSPPSADTEIWAERADDVIKERAIGDKLTLDFCDLVTRAAEQNGRELDAQTAAILKNLPKREMTVCGIVQSPLHFVTGGDPSYNNPADAVPDTAAGVEGMDVLEAIYYIPLSAVPTYRDALPVLPEEMNAPIMRTNDIYVAIADRRLYGGPADDYRRELDGLKQELSAIADCEVLTLNENYSFKSLAAYGDKVKVIGYILMAGFLLVTALVVFSTMTRLLSEERAQIACLVTLGYSPPQILFKYLLFALTATATGGFGAHFLSIGISNFVYAVFGASYVMPPVAAYVAPLFYFLVLGVIIFGTLAVTAVAGEKMTGEMPTSLLRPKAPRAGKRVLLEKIPALWSRLPFKYKSTLRNVFRYVNRFLMSVVSVAFSMGLVLTGLALLDLNLFRLAGTAAIVGISVIIIAFAGILTAVVIYTLTNINISERSREIATLMVLGYTDNEVTGYIFREIYINSAVGAVFGYPVGALLIQLLYTTIGSGFVGEVSWFMWLAAPIVVMLFTFLVTLALRRRILSVDMNDSLKAIE